MSQRLHAPHSPPFPVHDELCRLEVPDTGQFCNQIIQSARQGIIVYGLNLRYLLWNPYMERLTGLTAREVLGRHPLELFPFLQQSGLMATLEQALGGATPDPLDFPFEIPQTGCRGWVSDASAPLRNGNGEIVGIIGTVLDISNRKQAELALQQAHDELEQRVAERTVQLQQSHELLTSLSRQVPGMIFQFRMLPDGSFRIPYASDAIAHLYGVTAQEVRRDAEPLLRKIHTDDYQHFTAAVRNSASTQRPAQIEFRVELPNQGLAWRMATARPEPLPDGGCLWHGFSTDITERKRLEQELRESRSKLHQAQHMAKMGSWHWYVDGNRLTWSEEMFTLTGSDPSQPPLPFTAQPDRYTPDSFRRLQLAVQQALATGHPYQLELELVRPDGRHLLTVARGEAIRDRSGQVVELHGTLQDITERKQLEQRLSAARTLESIGQLAAGVAHEVRNPLNAILSITEALFKEREIDANPEYEPYKAHIRTQVHRLAHLMNDLLDLGKPIPSSSLQPVTLYDLCRDTVNLWKSSGSSPNKQVVFSCDEGAACCRVLADSLKLQQVFFNLLENAGFHTPQEQKVRLHMLENSSTAPAQSMAVVRVIDTGRGIPEERFNRIFEPFYSDRKGGTGLGLALVKHFIEHMGGTVRIWNNTPAAGCTAEICIPLAEES